MTEEIMSTLIRECEKDVQTIDDTPFIFTIGI